MAAWARLSAEPPDGEPAPDRLQGELAEAARREREEPGAYLRVGAVFGDLAESAAFSEAYLAVHRSLGERGVEATTRSVAGAAARGLNA